MLEENTRNDYPQKNYQEMMKENAGTIKYWEVDGIFVEERYSEDGTYSRNYGWNGEEWVLGLVSSNKFITEAQSIDKELFMKNVASVEKPKPSIKSTKEMLDFKIKEKLDIALYPEDIENTFLFLIQEKYSLEQQDILNKTVDLVKEKHKGQYRQEQTPYYTHCLLASLNVLENKNTNFEDVIVALLHDTLEDTDLTIKEVSDIYGSEIAELVQGLSKKGQEVDEITEEVYYEKISKNKRLSILKGCDRLANIYSLYFAPEWKKREQYIKETETDILPIIKEHDADLFKELSDLLNFVKENKKLTDNELEQIKKLSEIRETEKIRGNL